MIEANKYKLGIFVVLGILLFLASMFMLGIREVFQPKVRFFTLFDESVQGLEVGTAVKLRGVSVGKVSKISLRTEDNFVRIDMEALTSSLDPGNERKKLTDAEKADFFAQMLRSEVDKGMRCRLEIASIATGMKFVGMDYFQAEKIPPRIRVESESEEGIYVPSTPSLLSGLSTSVSDVLAKIASIDFQKIAEEIKDSFRSLNKRLNDPKIDTLITKIENVAEHLETTSSGLNKALDENKLREIVDDIHSTVNSIKTLSDSLKKELDEAKIPSAFETAKRTMDETGKAAASISEMKGEVSTTVDKLNEAIDSFTELVRSLEEDPSSVIRGRQKTEDYR